MNCLVPVTSFMAGLITHLFKSKKGGPLAQQEFYSHNAVQEGKQLPGLI